MIKNIIIGIAVAIILVGYTFYPDKGVVGTQVFNAHNFTTTATSGPMTVLSNDQLLATSSSRTYASICNTTATQVYLNLDQDIGASVNATTVIIAGAAGYNACYVINGDNLYTGAINASSTIGAVLLLVSEYN